MTQSLMRIVATILLLAMIVCLTLGLSLDSWSFERLMSVLSGCPDIYTPLAQWFSRTYVKLSGLIEPQLPNTITGFLVSAFVNGVYYLTQFFVLGCTFFIQMFIFTLYFIRYIFVVNV